MALRRSQWNEKKSSDELEKIVPESELTNIDMEEVEMPVENEDDEERQPSKKKKTIGPNFEKQQKQQKYYQAASDYHVGKFKSIRQAAEAYNED